MEIEDFDINVVTMTASRIGEDVIITVACTNGQPSVKHLVNDGSDLYERFLSLSDHLYSMEH
ncbi:hypothetical protein KIV66_gp82 [Mycobacterium phage MyraDee]|uniref:Uncharacterized protein n=1 Tax=Mycobacterium phage MyraDee TaxID=2024303 RepID=A0A222YY37_9CAUD|nr:hypothetical protein KIV66_gp82 [Mycobacterium phage MyraDee]ASR77189.1 hypothetical protein SEA_MYRADEE_82 [Mycobacterium phage MyraDee]